MSLKGEEILESLKRIITRSEEAFTAVQRLLDETKRFSQQVPTTEAALKSCHSQLETHLFTSLTNGLALQSKPVDSPASEVSQERRAPENSHDNKAPIFEGFSPLSAAFFPQASENAPEANTKPCPNFTPPQTASSVGVKNKNGNKMFKKAVQSNAPETVDETFEAFTAKLLTGNNSIASLKHEVDLTFDWSDWQPTDFPGAVSFVDIIQFMVQRREAATPMAIANRANMFQPCFNVETLLNFVLKQYDRLTTGYICNEPEKTMARQLLREVVLSWGASESLELFNSQELTANRRPPPLRYYFFARLCIKKFEAPVPEILRKKAALNSYVAGLAALCVPSTVAAASNPSREYAQAVFDEAVKLIEEKCQSTVYESARHLVQDNLAMVAIYGYKFSAQRILSHEWTMSPPFVTPGLITDSSKVAPYYVAMRLTHEFIARLGKAKGILYHGSEQNQTTPKSKPFQ